MKRFGHVFGSQTELLFAAVGFGVIAAVCVFELVSATPSWAQSPAQNATAASLAYGYEVATIKPNKPSDNGVRTGMTNPPDGFTATGYTLQSLIQQAFGIQNYQISGAPAWLNSERYDIDAKMDGAVADALQKLTPEERTSARQQMLQALFADRLKLTFHRETKELPIYTLVIAKNGSKLTEAKPGDTYTNGSRGAAGRGGAGGLMTTRRIGSESARAQTAPLTELVRVLAQYLGRTVVDKTGLTGNYDFTLQWATDESGLQSPGSTGIPAGTPPMSATDPSGPTLFAAIQEQLGLKLESGKGPVEVIVIDHVERPSGN